MANVVVVGAQWGDEGKGKIVDVLAARADIVVRYSGGANAGHTLLVDGKKIVLHLIPSGVLHRGKRCALGDGMVIDLATLCEERDQLRALGYLEDDSVLRISARAHVIFPYHRALDEAHERTAAAIGTTKRGIGPAYEDKTGRRGIRVGDLLDGAALRARLRESVAQANARLAALGGPTFDVETLASEALRQAEAIAPHITDVSRELDQAIARGENLLLEGAQGTLLDIDHGTYPYVTATTTTAGGACAGAGIGPTAIDRVTGISKAYATRVGAGPFPTELGANEAEKLRQAGGEFGATTGRPRRCGWLDLAALRFARRINGLTGLCITKLDVLRGNGPIQVCVGYRLGARIYDEIPLATDDLLRAQPVYETLDGFDDDLAETRRWDQLPKRVQEFCQCISDHAGVPIDIISVGAAREATVVVRNPFAK